MSSLNRDLIYESFCISFVREKTADGGADKFSSVVTRLIYKIYIKIILKKYVSRYV